MSNWEHSFTLDKSKGQIFFSGCQTCNASTRHEVITSVEDDSKTDYHPFILNGEVFHSEVWEMSSHQIIKCLGCESLSFRVVSVFSEDTEMTFDEQYGDYVDTPVSRTQVFPKRIIRQAISDTELLPRPVAEIYRETRSALANNELILAGMGIRALVEAVCNERAASGKDLASKIDSLASIGLLTADSTEFLHGLRLMGNDAAHEAKRYSEDDLLLALEVAEHLLTNAYIIPARAKKLPKRRS